MTEQITVPRATWDAVVEALEHLEAMTERYRPLNAPFPDAQKKAREALTAANAVSEQAPKKLIGWRTADYLLETDDPEMAKNWDVHYEILPIFEGDANTKLTAAPKAQTTESVRVQALNKLGKRLAELLDEDQWAECEKLLISLRGEQPVAANAVPQSQMPTIECSYLESKDDVVTNATLVIGDKTHRMVGEAMYFEVKHKLESLARTVMADQTVIDLPRIQSGKPLYQLIMEENARWLKEDDV